MVTSLFGQSPKVIKAETEIYLTNEDKWRGSELELYEYSGDLLTKYTDKKWYSLPEKYINSEIIEYQYNDDDQLQLRLLYNFTSADEIIQNFYWDEYFYDEKGCLIAQKDSVSSIHGIYDQHYIEYQVDENCNPIEELKTSLPPSGILYYHKTKRVFNESNVILKDTLFRRYNDNWIVARINDYSYDTAGRLIENHVSIHGSFNGTEETEEWTFAEHDQLIHYIRWRKTSSNPYKIIKKDSIVIDYDDQYRVSKKELHQTNFATISPVEYYTYDYYCQDVLRQSGKEDLPRIYRTFYEYGPGFDDECAEELENTSISIYPNPSLGEITITSDLLVAESAVVRVFDVAGRELYSQDFLISKDTHSLDLSFLITGIFMISIQTEGFVKTEKVMIL
jgi:hypothetical protein